MNSKTKNIISNILGLVVVLAAFYAFFFEEDLVNFYTFCGMIVFGLALFLFEAPQIKEYLTKFIDKKMDEEGPSE